MSAGTIPSLNKQKDLSSSSPSSLRSSRLSILSRPRPRTFFFLVWLIVFLSFPKWYGQLADPYGLRVFCLYGVCKQNQVDRGYHEGTYAGDRDERYLVCLAACERGCERDLRGSRGREEKFPLKRGLSAPSAELSRVDAEANRWDVGDTCEKKKPCERQKTSEAMARWRERIVPKGYHAAGAEDHHYRPSWRLDTGWDTYRRWRQRYRARTAKNESGEFFQNLPLGLQLQQAFDRVTTALRFLLCRNKVKLSSCKRFMGMIHTIFMRIRLLPISPPPPILPSLPPSLPSSFPPPPHLPPPPLPPLPP